MKILVATICLASLVGCAEMLAPSGGSGGKSPTPGPSSTAQRIEIVLKVDGEGRINVGGSGAVDVRSKSDADSCECGCGKPGCVCVSNDLSRRMPAGSPASAQTGSDAGPRTERREDFNTSRDLFVLSVEGCRACQLAMDDLRRLGFETKLVYGETSPNGLYPAIRNRRGTIYTVDDAVWNSGVDDVAAARKLSE